MLKSQCISCCLRVALQHYLFIPLANGPFEIINIDVWGISLHSSSFCHKYYVTFNDDHSRFTRIYFLHYKSQIFLTFKKFHHLVETQFNSKIKILRWDSRREYQSGEMPSFLFDKEINHKKILPLQSLAKWDC